MNRKEYKKSMSGIHPSDQVVERIMDMTNKEKKSSLVLKRLASVTLAFAVLVGGGFGANAIVNNHNDNPIVENSIVESNPLRVMVVYAGEYMPVSDIKVGSMNEQQVFYSIHYADKNDKVADEKLEQVYASDRAKIEKEMDALSSNGHSSVMHTGKSTIDSTKGEASVKVYVINGGAIGLNLDEYSNVKKMTISNESKYGELFFNYVTNAKKNGGQQIGNKISISGNELRESHASKLFECGTNPVVNKGYELFWNITDDVYKAIGNDLNFDLSQIKDTITFTVEFNDGTVQTASLNLYFDSEGYMHFS